MKVSAGRISAFRPAVFMPAAAIRLRRPLWGSIAPSLIVSARRAADKENRDESRTARFRKQAQFENVLQICLREDLQGSRVCVSGFSQGQFPYFQG